MKKILYIFYKLIDLIIPDEFLFIILNNFNNKLFADFTSYKLIIDRNHIQNSGLTRKAKLILNHRYWKSRDAIYYFIHSKNQYLSKRKKQILNSLFNEIKLFNIKRTKYFEIGCGYPIYLRHNLLQKKIRNYEGYDINMHISEFFNLNNVHNFYPKNNYDVIFILSGVIKYFSKKEINKLFIYLKKINPKKIIISHEEDYSIIKNKFRNIRKILITKI